MWWKNNTVFMKTKFILILSFLFLEISFAQSDFADKIEKANKLVEAKDYSKAIKLYKQLTQKYRNNADIQLKLANVYFLNNDVEKGCKCLDIAIILDEKTIDEDFISRCGNYKAKVKSLKDVDAFPTFLYQGEYQNLIENNEVNPKYLQLIWSELRKHKYVHLYDFDKVDIHIRIGINGQFKGEVKGLEKDNDEIKEIRNTLLAVLYKIKYKPALYKDNPVEIFEDILLKMKRV
jgi:tetratricopeptide (TPR) repeat protein